MNYKSTTIDELFGSKVTFSIPVYQRAYSWEEKNWREFLEDILEQVNKDNGYSYGNILLEIMKEGSEYEVIDGQQRLTTLIIFMRSLINVLRNKKIISEDDARDMENDFIKRNGRIKLRPVLSDCACFDAVIVENTKHKAGSSSQKRIKQAKNYFDRGLAKLDSDTLKKVLDVIRNTKINRLELQGKKEAALMFELQNNRGKDLTNMEKLKSYFMYQMYVYSKSEETDCNVETVSNNFSEIYKTVYDIKDLEEDSILIYHCNAYLNVAFGYRTIDDIKDEFKKAQDKVQWIKDFTLELSQTFKNLKRLQGCKSIYYQNMESMGFRAFVYPFIIKGYKFFGEDEKKLDVLLHLMEILTFRYCLIGSRAILNSRLSGIIRQFNGDVAELRNSLKDMSNNAWYWSDYRTEDFLNGWMYGNPVLNYLLWQYENFLQNKGYSVGTCKIDKEQIEHISPQNPPEGEALASGYDVDKNNKYTQEFIDNELNCIGNLMLISGSHNASIGNEPFKDKLASYESNPLLKQQQEIPTFLDDGVEEWKTAQIEKRKAKIVEFAIERWNFDSVEI